MHHQRRVQTSRDRQLPREGRLLPTEDTRRLVGILGQMETVEAATGRGSIFQRASIPATATSQPASTEHGCNPTVWRTSPSAECFAASPR